MLDLTFGEQVKIILSRRGMTIKDLAEKIEASTGKKMSRQNLTQRLGRDNFQEQDMRMIAEILGCPFHLTILEDGTQAENNHIEEKAEARQAASAKAVKKEAVYVPERDITIGELVDIHEELDELEKEGEKVVCEEEPVSSEAVIYEEEPVYEEEVVYEEEPVYEEAVYEEEPAYEEAVYEEEPVYVEESGEAWVPEEAETEEKPEELTEDLEAEVEMAVEVEEKPEEESVEAGATEPEEKPEEKVEQPEKEEKAEEKPHGLMSYLRRRKKKVSKPAKEAEEVKEPVQEEADSATTADAQEEEPEELRVRPQSELDEGYKADLDEMREEELYPEGEYGVYGEEYEETFGDEAAAEEFLVSDGEEDLERGDVNPYTGREYESNSVRMHPTRIGYVQVYDRAEHAWTDMTEWAFLGYQERKKALLGKDYEPPIYLD